MRHLKLFEEFKVSKRNYGELIDEIIDRLKGSPLGGWNLTTTTPSAIFQISLRNWEGKTDPMTQAEGIRMIGEVDEDIVEETDSEHWKKCNFFRVLSIPVSVENFVNKEGLVFKQGVMILHPGESDTPFGKREVYLTFEENSAARKKYRGRIVGKETGF